MASSFDRQAWRTCSLVAAVSSGMAIEVEPAAGARTSRARGVSVISYRRSCTLDFWNIRKIRHCRSISGGRNTELVASSRGGTIRQRLEKGRCPASGDHVEFDCCELPEPEPRR